MTNEIKAALEAMAANPKLAAILKETIKKSGEMQPAASVEALETDATAAEVLAKVNEILVALKAAGLMA